MNDFSSLVALNKNLRNRVLYYEMKEAVGQKNALEYMDLIADVKELETAPGSPVTSGAAEIYYNELKSDLYNSGTGVWRKYTETEAKDKIKDLKSYLLWTDIHMNTSALIKTEMEDLIEEVEAYEGTSYSEFYMKYLWKYYYSEESYKEDNYMRALYELRTRVLNIRMTQLKGLETALEFNIHLIELKYYAGTEDTNGALIESATYYNDFVKAKLTSIGANTDSGNSAHTDVADDIIEELNRRVLWDFFAHNTSVADRDMYRDVYIAVRWPALKTRLGSSDNHQQIQEGLLQDEKDLLNLGQDADFQTIWDDFKLLIMYAQFKADVADYDDDYDATDGSVTLSLLYSGVSADDELQDTIFVAPAPGLNVVRASQITLEEGLWSDLDGGDADAYVDKFYDYRIQFMRSKLTQQMNGLTSSGADANYFTAMRNNVPKNWYQIKEDLDSDLYTPRQFVKDAIDACTTESACRTYLEELTIALFEHHYNEEIGNQYDEEASPIAVDDNATSHEMDFIEDIWKVRYTTTDALCRSIAENPSLNNLEINMVK